MTPKQVAHDWLPIALKEIKARIKALKVYQTGELYNTINGSIKELSGGSTFKAEILYNYYGIFPDMGVGKGVPRDEVSLQRQLGGSRKRKPWAKEIAHQGHIFGEQLGKAWADAHNEAIGGSLQRKITMKF